jgi:hypothetical protein
MKLEIDDNMKSKEFKHWLAKQGATFAPGFGESFKSLFEWPPVRFANARH